MSSNPADNTIGDINPIDDATTDDATAETVQR